MTRRLCLTLALLALAGAPVSAELKYTMRTTFRALPDAGLSEAVAAMGRAMLKAMPPEGLETVTVVGDGRVRIEQVRGSDGTPTGAVTLTRPDGTFVVMDPQARTYWTASLDVLQGQLELARRQGGLEPVSSTTPTGERTTILGLEAERVAFTWRMPLPRPELPADASPAVREALAELPDAIEMAGDFWVATDRYRQYAKASARAAVALRAIGLDMIPTDRFVLRSTLRVYGVEMDAVVTALAEQDLPDSLFEVPAGYTEVSAPIGGRGGASGGRGDGAAWIDNVAADR